MAAGADIMRDIGNSDGHFPASAIGFGMDSVIEIPRVIAINRDQRQCAQIRAPTCGNTLRRFCFA